MSEHTIEPTIEYQDTMTTTYLGDAALLSLPQDSIQAVITGPPYIRIPALEETLLNKVLGLCANFLVDGGILCTINTDLRNNGLIRPRHILIYHICLSYGLKLFDYHIWNKDFKRNPYRIAFSHIMLYCKGDKPRIKRSFHIEDIITGKAQKFGEFRDALPESVVEEVIRAYTTEGDTIYNPFSGTGTILLEAKKQGRKSIGIEIDKSVIHKREQFNLL